MEKSIIFQCFRYFVQTDFLTKPLPTEPAPEQTLPSTNESSTSTITNTNTPTNTIIKFENDEDESSNNNVKSESIKTETENDDSGIIDEYGNYEDPDSDDETSNDIVI